MQPAFMNMLQLLLLLAAASRADVLRASCPNPSYELWPERTYGLFYDQDPDFGFCDFQYLMGRRMLEIGGPTAGSNMYDHVKSVDNVIQLPLVRYFAQFGNVEHDPAALASDDDVVVDGSPYAPRGAAMGRVFRRHGARLEGFADASYEAVASVHSLEHFLDPLEALAEWDRVLAPGGILLLVLPQVGNCTDKHRTPASMQELLAIRGAAARGDIARVRGHYFELFVRLFDDQDTDFDPFGLHAVNNTDDRRKVLRNYTSVMDDVVHWHAWDFDLIHETVAGCLGYDVLGLKLLPPMPPAHCPWHQIVLARKPG